MDLRQLTTIAAISIFTASGAFATKVACVGNSITFGYGLNWDEKTYPQNLQIMLGDDFEVGNFGHSGMMFHKKSNESYWTSPKFKEAYEFQPDIVVIELGTNDSKYFHDGAGSSTGYNYYAYDSKGYSRADLLDEMKKDYEALIDTFAHQPQAPTIYATLQPYANNWDWFITDTVIVNVINPLIKEVATNKGVQLIDLHESFNKPEWLLDDNVHPNANGAYELAAIIAKSIRPASGNETPANSSNSADISSSSSANNVSDNEETGILHETTALKTYTGDVSIFDLNGNYIKKVYANGSLDIKNGHKGTFIVKAGRNTQKIILK